MLLPSVLHEVALSRLDYVEDGSEESVSTKSSCDGRGGRAKWQVSLTHSYNHNSTFVLTTSKLPGPTQSANFTFSRAT